MRRRPRSPLPSISPVGSGPTAGVRIAGRVRPIAEPTVPPLLRRRRRGGSPDLSRWPRRRAGEADNSPYVPRGIIVGAETQAGPAILELPPGPSPPSTWPSRAWNTSGRRRAQPGLRGGRGIFGGVPDPGASHARRRGGRWASCSRSSSPHPNQRVVRDEPAAIRPVSEPRRAEAGAVTGRGPAPPPPLTLTLVLPDGAGPDVRPRRPRAPNCRPSGPAPSSNRPNVRDTGP
jgi:hypothetical protein